MGKFLRRIRVYLNIVKINYLDLKDGDVVLYLIRDKENPPQIEAEIPQEVEENTNNILSRGFNRFREYGVSPSEIHVFRLLFHSAYFANNRHNFNQDWNPEVILNREEQWLQNQNDEMSVDFNERIVAPFALFRNMRNRNNDVILHINNSLVCSILIFKSPILII